MPISDERLNEWRNFLIASKDDILNNALLRLQQAGGKNGWHLIVESGAGEFLVILFDALADMLKADPRLVLRPLALLDLPKAKVVEKASMGTAVAEETARGENNKLIVVTQNGTFVGVLYEGAKRSGEAAINVASFIQSVKMGNGGETHFDAYPSLDAPDQVAPDETFQVTVGFRADVDPDLLESQPIHIENPPPEAKFLIMLVVDGLKVLDGNHRPLSLSMEAKVTFTCQPKPGVSYATVSVHFIYDEQMVGMAKRGIAVGAGAGATPPQQPAAKPNPCRMSLPSAENRPDLQVTITQSGGQLQWTFVAPKPKIQLGPIATELADAREFAGDLISELRKQNYKGFFAAQTLENKGQDIADIMPPEFFDALRQVHASVKRMPTLLLLTEETYVPWELALLDEPLDANLPPFLAAQTIMGRWLLHEKVAFPPPTAIEVKRVTAVAAKYGLGTDMKELKEAIAERAMLVDQHGAQPLEATQADLVKVISGEKTAGHLIHFAVHGLSDPDANDQALLLADKNKLTPGALIGRYKCGQTPLFSFVFLNACQVGTAGSSLGQAAGFPGDVIRGGAMGFIAPLWEVHDEVAYAFAEEFYKSTLKGEHKRVAEVLQAERCKYDRNDSTTPVAYVYYGHPALRLQK